MAQSRPKPFSKNLDLLFSQWFTGKKDIGQLPLTPQFKAFVNDGWPVTVPFSSPITPVYLIQVLALEILNKQTQWLVCDGAVPMLWFFKNNPEPRNVKTRLYIREEIISLVPRAWRKVVRSFRVASVRPKFDPPRKLDTIFLTGLMSGIYCSLENLETLLHEVEKVIAVHGIRSPKIKTFLPLKYFSHSAELGQIYHMEYMKKLVGRFGSNIETMSFSQFEAYDKFQSAMIFDINDFHFSSSSYLLNLALSKGATSGHCHRKSRELPANFAPLSLYHGLLLNGVQDTEEVSLKFGELYSAAKSYHEKVFKTMSSSANLSLPWPYWFSEWVRATDDLKYF